jgi:hypothetical protein
MQSTNNSFKIVAAMNLAFGNAEGVRTNPDFARVQNQCKNIGDEIGELNTAYSERNMSQVRDALCDICVFAYGGHHMIGIPGWELRHLKLLFSNNPTPESIAFYLDDIVNTAASMQESIGVLHDDDMQDVIDGVMTRFVKDDSDKEATYANHNAKHKAKGGEGELQVYYEGEYPKMIMKSLVDQPDAPKDKFLKSESFKDTVFGNLDLQPYHLKF